MAPLILPFAAGVLAAAMNAVAGGGSFVTLPAMVAAGLPALNANASSTVALIPGSLLSTWVYRDDLKPVAGAGVLALLAASLAGGLLGAVLLLWTPPGLFDRVLPWLLLLATAALAFGRRIAARMSGSVHARRLVLPVQFLLGIYGGYFGGAAGLMMLAAWSLMGAGGIRALQGPRTLLVSAANIVAACVFAASGAVWWPQTLAMLAGALIGGYAGARLARLLPEAAVRAGTVGLTALVTAVFFWRGYA